MFRFDLVGNPEVKKRPSRCILIVLAIFLCAVSVGIGVIIGWFSHPSDVGTTCPGNQPGSTTFDPTKYIIQNINKDKIKETLRSYSSRPRLPGFQLSADLGNEILSSWKQNGIDNVQLASYDVLLSFPNSSNPNKVQIIDGLNNAVFTSAPIEKPFREDENQTEVVPPYNAFSPAGVVSGDLVYVNYGTIKDFWLLTRNLSVDVSGKIVIARYGKIFRGDKLRNAQKFNASGIILYSDPSDFNMNSTNKPYPDSWWLPSTGIQRGTVGPNGDTETPLYPSTYYAHRLSKDKLDLPKIPCQPIGYGDAQRLLQELDGPEVPKEWQGKLEITYRLGPGLKNKSRKVRLEVNNFEEIRTIHNVIAFIRGAEEPDRFVLLGNHHDSWAFGAIDPLSGTAALTEMTRVFGQMMKIGYRPRRTIVFCSWDGEEPGLIGSMEWVEENMKVLYERAVAYLNVDYAADGIYNLAVGTSPLLQDALYQASKKVPHPELTKGEKSLYDLWKSRSEDSSEPDVYYSLGSGSDMATFYQRAGVPSVDVWFSYDTVKLPILSYPTYHSRYETFYMYSTYIDPSFNYTCAVAQFWAVLANDLASEKMLPFDARRYSTAIQKFLQTLVNTFGTLWQKQNVNIDAFKSSTQNFTAATNRFQRKIDNMKSKTNSVLELRMLNDKLMQLERAFIDPEGLPGRPHYKHTVFAPSRYDAYVDNSFPGIMDTMYNIQQNGADKWDLLKHEVYVATYMIQSAANTLDDIGLRVSQ